MMAPFEPPYYAVIFSSVLNEDAEGYEQMADSMVQLAARQPGFLGVESVREHGLGITVSYWATEESLRQWKRVTEHRAAQEMGRSTWYRHYRVRVARVERDYEFPAAI
jgi:heme-degrading monooxygenase HmoA